MGLNSGVDWTDHTWNPWQGCRKVSPGCAHCYMYRDKARYGQDPATVVRSKPATFNAPLKWKDPARVFVCSWSDFFIEDADAWRPEAWEIMRRTPHLTYMLLTKRPENIPGRLPSDWPLAGVPGLPPDQWPWRNVWLGVTAEDQQRYNERVRLLIRHGLAASVIFISIEPMLGPIEIHSIGPTTWIILGGESGPNARPMEDRWALDVKTRCHDLGVPFFMKQMSGKAPIPEFLQGREFPGSI